MHLRSLTLPSPSRSSRHADERSRASTSQAGAQVRSDQRGATRRTSTASMAHSQVRSHRRIDHVACAASRQRAQGGSDRTGGAGGLRLDHRPHHSSALGRPRCERSRLPYRTPEGLHIQAGAMMIVHVVELRIVWVDDPEASFYEVPCKGCVGYCDLEDTPDGTGTDFGTAQCSGLTLIRRTTVWRAIVRFQSRGAVNIVEGSGQSAEQAVEDAKTSYAAMRLCKDREP